MILDMDLIIDCLHDAGLDGGSLREDYSGRGMYGDECFGIVCEPSEAFQFAVAVAESEELDAPSWIGKVKADSMGLSTIWYWPGVTVE